MRIALVGLSPLTALGFEALITRLWPLCEVLAYDITHTGHSHAQREADGFHEWQQADCHIVSASALAMHARFFMPRLDKILLVTSSAPDIPQHAAFAMVSPSASIKDLTNAVEQLKSVSYHENAAHDATTALTTREIDVLKLTALGKTAKQVAAELCISVNTVLTHRKNISSKLGLRSAPALTHYAMVHGLLQ